MKAKNKKLVAEESENDDDYKIVGGAKKVGFCKQVVNAPCNYYKAFRENVN